MGRVNLTNDIARDTQETRGMRCQDYTLPRREGTMHGMAGS